MKLKRWLLKLVLVYCASFILFTMVRWSEPKNEGTERSPVQPNRENKWQLLNDSSVRTTISAQDLRAKFGRTKDKWVRIAYSEYQVFVFSAYLDMRVSDFRLARKPAVRMPVILESALSTQWLQKPSMFLCYFPSLNISVHAHLYEQCENHDQPFGAYIVNCLVDHKWTKSITSVQLRPSKSHRRRVDRHHNIPVSKVLAETGLSPVVNITVCVHTPIFGSLYSAEYLIRYLELVRLLGGEHFIFYLADRSERLFEDHKLLDVLRKYEAEGLATVIDFGLPMERPTNIWYHGQSSAVQDCIYRSIGATNFLVLSDLDEFIVPIESVDWLTLFEELWTDKPNATGFHVKTSYFHSGRQKKRAEFAPFIHFDRLKTSWTLTKCVVRPERVFEMGIHHISKQFREHFSNENLNASVALLHHYVTSRASVTLPLFDADRIMLRYKDDFQKRVDKVLYNILKDEQF